MDEPGRCPTLLMNGLYDVMGKMTDSGSLICKVGYLAHSYTVD